MGMNLSGFGLGRAFFSSGLLSGFLKFAPFLTFTKLACQKITLSRDFLAEFGTYYTVFSDKKNLFDICQVFFQKSLKKAPGLTGFLDWSSGGPGLAKIGRARRALRAWPEVRNITKTI